MKILKRFAIGMVVLVAVLALVGMLLPGEYGVERSVVVKAPAEIVFEQVNDLKKNEAWSPWKDPTMKISYSAVTAGEGASSSWESEEMGNGTQVIEESLPHRSIRTHLDFGDMGTAKVHWTFVPGPDGVKVTQSMTGDQGMNPVKRYFGLMMDRMIGPMFEKGLASLKEVSEARVAELDAEMLADMAVLKQASDSTKAGEAP